jgi:outer membrane protein OmpA-like peptidoglycan-associated protein
MKRSYRRTATIAWVCMAAGALWSAAGETAAAGQLSEREIIDTLTQQPRTRSLSPSARSQDDRSFLQSLRGRSTRSLSVRDRDHIGAIAQKKPSVNLEIYFDFDSAAITEKAMPQLMSLGRALSSARLKDALVLVGGHTDAKGADAYNQGLSERRAEAVRTFLIARFQIRPDSLKAVGYGEQQLENNADPYAAENRRVQIVNLAAGQTANR